MADGVARTTIKINDQASAALRNINVALAATVHGTDNLERALESNTAALNSFNASSEQTNNANKKSGGILSGLKSKLVGLAAAYASVETARAFLRETDMYIQNQARLNIMNDGLQTNAELYDKIYNSAQRSLMPLNDVASNVSQLGIVAKDAFANNDEIIGFVEIFNKAASVAGASSSMKANAMYQLSQAFGSGRLQGDELRSVRENAPLLWKAIEKELGQSFGEDADFKKIAADGLISPDVIKRAAFASGKEIDEAFKNMPLSLGDIMTQASNKFKKALESAFQTMMKVYNNPGVKKAINVTTNIVILAAKSVFGIAKGIASVIMWISKWEKAVKIIGIGLGILTTIILTSIAVHKIYRISVATTTFFTKLFTASTRAATLAQIGLNLAAIKFTLVVLAIIAVVVLMSMLVIANLDKIVGAWYWWEAAFKNGVKHMSNLWNTITEGIAFAWDLTVSKFNIGVLYLKKAWNSFATSMMEIFFSVADKINTAFAAVINPIINGINKAILAASALPGLGELANKTIDAYSAEDGNAERASMLAEMKADALSISAELEKAKKVKISRSDYNFGRNTDFIDKDAEFEKGKAAGLSMQDEAFKMIDNAKAWFSNGGSFGELDKSLGGIGKKDDNPFLKEIADNTGATAKNTEKSKDEDYKLLRDIMRQRAISRLGSVGGGTVKVDMTNNNNLSSSLDSKLFFRQLADTINEAAYTSAQAVHA